MLFIACQQTSVNHVTDQLARHGPRASNHLRQIFVTQLKNDEGAARVFDPETGAGLPPENSAKLR